MSCLNNYNLDVILNQLNCWCLQWRGKIATVFPSGMTQIEQIQTLYTAVKNTAEAQIETMEQFCELYTFVKDYFENLDLQEEVNNWMDKALKDGTLHEILNNLYENLKLEIQSVASGSPKGVYKNLEALKKAIPTGNNNIYITLNDGKWNYWNGSEWTAGGTYLSSMLRGLGILLSPCNVNFSENNIVFTSLNNVITATDGLTYVSLDPGSYTLSLETAEEYQTLFIGINKTSKQFVATNISHFINNDDVIFFGYVNIQYDFYYINGYNMEYNAYFGENTTIKVIQNTNSQTKGIYLRDYENSIIYLATNLTNNIKIDFSTLNSEFPDNVSNGAFKISASILCYNIANNKFELLSNPRYIKQNSVILIGDWYGSVIPGLITELMETKKYVSKTSISFANVLALGVEVDWTNTKNIYLYGGNASDKPLNILMENGKRIPIATDGSYTIEYPPNTGSITFFIIFDATEHNIVLMNGATLNASNHELYMIGYVNYSTNIISVFGANNNEKAIVDYSTTMYNGLSFLKSNAPDNKLIAFITDLHYLVYPESIDLTLEVINKLADMKMLSCVILGGDYTDGTFSDPADCIKYMLYIKEKLPSSIPCFMLRGNHDDNSYSTSTSEKVPLKNIVTTNQWISNLIITQYNRPENKIYGYYDIDDKTRLVLLDYADYPIQEVGSYLLYNGRNWMGFSDEMITYLAENVFTDPNKKYLIFCHGSYKKALSAYGYNVINSDRFIKLINAVQNGSEFEEKTFGGFNNNIIFYYSGHNHSDFYSYENDIESLFVSTGCAYLLTKQLVDETLLKAGFIRYTDRNKDMASCLLFDLIDFKGNRARIGAGINNNNNVK